MTDTSTLLPDATTTWVDRYAPVITKPYLKLMRLDRPIGTWLLLLPCWWGLVLASHGLPDWRYMLWFAIGAVVMRGAGCTYNDIIDRSIDQKVDRTKDRPLAGGQLTQHQAIIFLGAQLLVGLAVLLQFNPTTVMVGMASLVLVFTYPLMKRITYWPQLFLGLTFNWGIWLGWFASGQSFGIMPVVLYVGAIFWTLGYDTIYAVQDRDDDMLAGIKSTAIRLFPHLHYWLILFYGLFLSQLIQLGVLLNYNWIYFAVIGVSILQFIWQVATLDVTQAADCLSKFRSNRYVGWIVLAALLSQKFF